jgi:hypothetical protein
MRITFEQANTGSGLEWAEREYRRIEVAVTRARNVADDYMLRMVRTQTALMLSQKAANTWRRNRYPTGGRASASAASTVFSKIPHIVQSHKDAAVITPRQGKFLAIPTENAPKRGTDNKRIRPSNWPESRLGKLRLIKTKRGYSLVVDNVAPSFVKATGRFQRYRLPGQRSQAKAAREGRSFQTAVMFHLIPVARMKKRLTPEVFYQQAVTIFFRTLDAYLEARRG